MITGSALWSSSSEWSCSFQMAINPEGACSRKKIKGLADCRKITKCNLQQGQTTGNQKDTSELRTSSEGVQSGSGRGLEAPNSAEFEAFGVRRGTSTKAACGHSTHRGTHCDHKPHPDKLPNRKTSQVVRSTGHKEEFKEGNTKMQQVGELT